MNYLGPGEVADTGETDPEALKPWPHRASDAFRKARGREASLIMSSIISDKPQNCLMACGRPDLGRGVIRVPKTFWRWPLGTAQAGASGRAGLKVKAPSQ